MCVQNIGRCRPCRWLTDKHTHIHTSNIITQRKMPQTFRVQPTIGDSMHGQSANDSNILYGDLPFHPHSIFFSGAIPASICRPPIICLQSTPIPSSHRRKTRKTAQNQLWIINKRTCTKPNALHAPRSNIDLQLFDRVNSHFTLSSLSRAISSPLCCFPFIRVAVGQIQPESDRIVPAFTHSHFSFGTIFHFNNSPSAISLFISVN